MPSRASVVSSGDGDLSRLTARIARAELKTINAIQNPAIPLTRHHHAGARESWNQTRLVLARDLESPHRRARAGLNKQSMKINRQPSHKGKRCGILG